jgi:hypothetical protein
VIRGIDSEKMCDDRGRDRCHIPGHEISTATRDESVEQVVAELADEGLDAADPMLRDRGVDDPADRAVARFVSRMSCSSGGTTSPAARKLTSVTVPAIRDRPS